MKIWRLTVVTKLDRNQAITVARESLSRQGGWITHHTLFSNHAATLNFELPSTSATAFIEKLAEAGLAAKYDGEIPGGDSGDLQGSLQMTFLHDDPDLKRDVPAFG